MKRLFWFGIGAVSGVAASRKVTKTARQASPAGVASNVGDALRELASAIGSFGADVRAGMAEREEQLHDSVRQTSGVSTRYSDLAAEPGKHASRRSR